MTANYWNTTAIDRKYDIGGAPLLRKMWETNTNGRNKVPTGTGAVTWVHRYLNGELGMPEGEHSHGNHGNDGSRNRVENGDVTISPFTVTKNFLNLK